MSQSTEVLTNKTPSAYASEVGRIDLIIRSALAGLRTAMPVQVMSVSNSGGVSPVGTVSVQPLVSMLDGSGQVWPHGIIYNVPYLRVQGGSNAVIIDPHVGDIGIATVCDRDISQVKASGGVSAPGSTRKNDLSDMVYLMTIIGPAPAQYIQFNASGITITSPGTVNINAQSANVTATSEVSVTAPSINLGPPGGTLSAMVTAAATAIYNAHTHISSTPGSATSAPSNSLGPSQLTSTVQAA